MCYKGMLNLNQCGIQMLHSNDVQVCYKMMIVYVLAAHDCNCTNYTVDP